MTPYDQGFMDKCAEFGITPRALRKLASVNPVLSVLGGSGKRFLQLLGGGSKATRARYNLVDRALRQEFSRLAGLENSRTLSADTIFSGVPKLLRRRIGGSTMHALEQATRKRYGHPELSGGDLNVANKYIEALSAVEHNNDAAMRSELLKVIGARLGATAGVGGVGYGTYKAVSGKGDK